MEKIKGAGKHTVGWNIRNPPLYEVGIENIRGAGKQEQAGQARNLR